MSSILPSSPVYMLNLPDNYTLNCHFEYRYYTIDEQRDDTNSNIYTSADYISSFGSPRKMVLEFDSADSLSTDDVIGAAFAQAEYSEEIFSADNIKRLTSELMLQSSGYTKLTTQTPTVQSYITAHGSGEAVNMIEAFFRGASSVSNASLFNDIAANLSVSNEVYLNSSTGMPVTAGGQTVSDLALQNFISTSYIHDIIEASAHDPFSAHGESLSKDLSSLKSTQVRQRKIVSPLVVNLDEYSIMVDPLELSKDPLDGTGIEGLGVVGYIILKYEVGDTSDEAKPAIAITNRLQTTFDDYNVKYGAAYRYDLHPLCILRYKDGSTYEHIFLVGTEAKTVEVPAVENIPPETIESIQFDWDGSNLNIRWSMPMGQTNDSGGPIGDIKGYQIFVRSTIDEPFTLKKMMLFYDGLDSFTSRENYGSKLTNYNYAPTQYTCAIDPDTEYIFSMCAIDAHGNSSNLSPQYSVKLDSYRNQLDVGFISFKGAPKQYPNFLMSDKIFLDALKVSGTNKISVYYNPEYNEVEFDPGSSLPAVTYPVTNHVETDSGGKAIHPSYRIQMINVNTQSDEILDIFLPNSD